MKKHTYTTIHYETPVNPVHRIFHVARTINPLNLPQ